MIWVLLLLMLVVGIALGSKLSALNARFMRLEPHLEAMLARIAALEKALEAAKLPAAAPEQTPNSQAYHDRWRAAAAEAAAEPRIVSEPVLPPEPEPALPVAPEEIAKAPSTVAEQESVSVEPAAALPEPESPPAPERVLIAARQTDRPDASSRTMPSLPKISISFEELIGGKLPIWVGGIALVIASFFLVGYAIDNGMLGPRVQVVLATVFGIALLVGSEAARRISKLADDPRVAQSFAGAGIASLYGTLYVASEAYGLVSPSMAFLLMAGVTAIALLLSLRHGPPTAIMGLIGGFVAPFSATPSGNITPLLVYLGLLIAGLFAVSINRGWRWLAIAATGGGMLWSLGLMLANQTGINATLGIFIVILTLGATMLMPRFGAPDLRTRIIPMLIGFAQLAIFAYQIDFNLSGWMLYALLSAASLFLGWRDAKLMPASLAALGLVLILLIGGFGQGNPVTIWAAIGATLLFSVPGHALARRPHTNWPWAALAIVGGTAPGLIAHHWGPLGLLGTSQWGLLFAAAALPQAWLSWRARGEGRSSGHPDWALFGAGLAAAIMVFYTVLSWLADDWQISGILLIALGLAAWARRTQDRALALASLAFWSVAMAFWVFSFVSHDTLITAIFAAGGVPPLPAMAALLILPGAAAFGMAWLHRGAGVRAEALCWPGLALALGLPLALVPELWHPATLFAAAFALGLGLRRFEKSFFNRASLVVLGAGALYWSYCVVNAPDLIWAVFAGGAMPAVEPLLALLALPAALIAGLAWTHAGRVSDNGLRIVAFGLAVALALALVPFVWQPAILALIAGLALAFEQRRPLPQHAFLGMALLTGAYLVWPLWPFAEIMVGSIIGETLHFSKLAPLSIILKMLALPALLFALWLWRFDQLLNTRAGSGIKAGLALVCAAALYALAKQPLAITTLAAFEAQGFAERTLLSQALLVASLAALWRGEPGLRHIAWTLFTLGLLRVIWFDLVLLNPVLVRQNIGALPLLNIAVLHFGAVALWLWLAATLIRDARAAMAMRYGSLVMTLVAAGFAVRQAVQGPFVNALTISETEQYGYSVAYLGLAIVWLWRGIVAEARWQRVTALLLLTLVTLKVFIYDASRLEGLLRIFSFMGLGLALIAIGWAYNRFVSSKAAPVTEPLSR